MIPISSQTLFVILLHSASTIVQKEESVLSYIELFTYTTFRADRSKNW